MNFVIVFVTTKDLREAKKISQALLKEKLAACVNVVPEIRSLYWWQGKIEKSREVLMIIKTKKPLVSKIIKKVKKLHSYKVPEIIALPIISGNKDYLSWLSNSLRRLK